MRRVVAVLATALLCSSAFLPASDAIADSPGEQDYIVLMKSGLESTAAQFAVELGGRPAAFGSFQAVASRLAANDARTLSGDPRVEALVPDTFVSLNLPATPQLRSTNFTANALITSQRLPNGVARLGPAVATNGAGVGVAVLDTGIELDHPNLKDAIAGQVTFVDGTTNANDDNGHGTHVAGTIAARDTGQGVRGVAPGVKLYAVKVLDSKGEAKTSTVLAGLSWVKKNAGPLGIKVVNLSMGGKGADDGACGWNNNDVIHRAICDLVAAGVTVVVAAGNDGKDVSQQVPASYREVIAVSALVDTDGKPNGAGEASKFGPDDTFASFSNYGSTVTVGAPGVSIFSTYRGGGYAALSGTSMAAPHVTGAAALYLASRPRAGVLEVRQAMLNTAERAGTGHTDPLKLHSEPVISTAGY